MPSVSPCRWTHTPSPPDLQPLVIDDVGIVDLETGRVPGGQTMIIANGRIVYAGSAFNAPVPPSARRNNGKGKGKLAIPGLWDLHVHTVALSLQLHFLRSID